MAGGAGSAREGATLSKGKPRPGIDTPHTAASARKAAMRLPLDHDSDSITDPKLRKAYLDRLQGISDEAEADHAQKKKRDRAPVVSRDPDNELGGKSLKTHPLAGGAPQPVQSAAGAILGAIVASVVLNFMRGGWARVRALAAAKFLNHTTDKPSTAATISPGGSQITSAVQADLAATTAYRSAVGS